MSDSYVQVAADNTGKKIQTFRQTVGSNEVHAQAVVLVDENGDPYTPLTSIPATHIARVDSNGDDSTGTIGDFGKPFLTVQAAIDAFIAIGSPQDGFIQLESTGFHENITVNTSAFLSLGFVGVGGQSGAYAFASLTITGGGGVMISIDGCGANNITADSSIDFEAANCYMGDITSTNGSVTVAGDFGCVSVANVTSTGTLRLMGVFSASILNANGADIQLFNCRPTNADPSGVYAGLPIINSAASPVLAIGSLIASITACGALTLKDSRVIGTNNANSTTYDDILLAGDDTAYDATSWNGNTRTPSKNAVRDMFETLGTLATQSGSFSGTSSGTNTGDQTTVSGNAGTATALQTARNIDGQSFDGTAAITVIAPGTHAATSKATPVDADEVPLVDSAASNVLKKLTWANLKATAQTYFDTLYVAIGGAIGTPSSGNLTNCTIPTATAAQTMAQTSTSLAVTPNDVAYGIFGMAWRYPSCYSAVDFSSANQSGTGANTINANGFSITSGATASSWAFKNSGGSLAGLSPSTSALASGLNFDKRMGFKITFRHDAGTTNGLTRFTFVNSTNVGANGSGTTAKLAGKGIGIEIRNAALWAAVHDGTTYASSSLSTTLTVNAYTTVGVFRSGSGTFDFYVNGAFVLTQSGGPTGNAASHTVTAYWAADNGGDSAAQTCLLTECAVFQAIG